MAKERKPLALLIGVGKPKPGGDDDDKPGEGEESDPGEESALEDFAAALKAGDMGKAGAALKDFGRICGWGKPGKYDE